MKPIRCIAIDDEPIALEKMGTYIRKIPFLELISLCESPFEAMQVMTGQQVDAIFVDINMPDLNGMDFIASMPIQPMVVFTTAYAEYAVKSYLYSAVDYLLKPFSFADFQRAANKLFRLHKAAAQLQEEPANDGDTLYVKVDYRYVNIKISDIMYVKGMNEYVQIFIHGIKPLMVHTTLKQIKERLPQHFIQVHRSYIVNMHKASEIERLKVIVYGDTRITVGDNYRKDFQNYLRTHSLGKRSAQDR